jgi:hypothetical protein
MILDACEERLEKLSPYLKKQEVPAKSTEGPSGQSMDFLATHKQPGNAVPRESSGVAPDSVAVVEQTFLCLKFEPQQGQEIGAFDLAFEPQNQPENWTRAMNVLKANNAVIEKRHREPGYQYSYWLFGDPQNLQAIIEGGNEMLVFVEGVCMCMCMCCRASMLLSSSEPYAHIHTHSHKYTHHHLQRSIQLEASTGKGPQYTHTHTHPRRG